jgi:hypothetical protein
VRPLAGFRRWRAWDGLLRSVYPWPYDAWRDAWVTGEATANERPTADGSSGLYAYYDLYPSLTAAPGLTVGTVVGWGHLVEGERGFRAEKARMVALLDADSYLPPMNHEPPADPDVIRALADAYDVPVLPRRELVEYARWYGDLVTPADVEWMKAERRVAVRS